MGEWISVAERLPELSEDVLIYGRRTIGNPHIRLQVGYLHMTNPNVWRGVMGTDVSDYPMCEEVTHWMPLPEPPEVEQ